MYLNKIKTVILLSLLTGIFMLLGLAFGGTYGLAISLIIALVINFVSYFYSDKIVLRMYNAQTLDPNRYSKIYLNVNQLSQAMEIPEPKIWLIQSAMANAFATGRNPQNASMAITTGILDILDERELNAVISHELSHIKNRDILITTIAATIATSIGYIANIMQYVAFWGGTSSEDGKKKSNPIHLLVLAIFMPIAATMIQLAISRSREYLADETGATCCKDPLALASALEKLHYNIKFANLNHEDTLHAGTASLFIIHPFTSLDWLSLFSTHPPMHKRIARLKNMYEKNI